VFGRGKFWRSFSAFHEPASAGGTLIESKAEAIPGDVGRFHVVTIGRALHWMDRDRIAVLWERLVASDGTILVCSSNSPLMTQPVARRIQQGTALLVRVKRRRAIPSAAWAVLQGTQFHVTDAITIETSRQISVSDLARRVLTFSSSSPAVLGNKVEPMLRDVQQRLLPLSCEGSVTEVVVSTAQVAKR